LVLERIAPIGDKLEKENMREAIKHILLKGAGLSPQRGCNNGYSIINKILFSAGGNTNKYNREGSCESVAEEYVGRRTSSNNTTNNPNATNNSSSYNVELTLLMDVCRELMISNPKFMERTVNIVTDYTATQGMAFQVTMPECYPSPTTINLEVGGDTPTTSVDLELRSRYDAAMAMVSEMVEQERKLLVAIDTLDVAVVTGTVREINEYRRGVNLPLVKIPQVFQALEEGRLAAKRLNKEVDRINTNVRNEVLPTININSITSELNQLNTTLSVGKIQGLEDMGSGSCPGLIIMGDHTTSTRDTTIPLQSGDTIILPRYNADVGHLETDVLKEVLFYLDALAHSTGNFDSLKTIITHELATRSKKR
jgi:hypothetical protein